jgi:hypothetical protein
MVEQVLNSSGQFTLLSLLLALVAYIRNFPIKILLKSEKKYLSKIQHEVTTLSNLECSSLFWIHLQLVGLNLIQIILSFLAVVIARHFCIYSHANQIEPEAFVSNNLYGLALVLFLYHLCANGLFICRSVKLLYYYPKNAGSHPHDWVTSYIQKRQVSQ